MFWSSLALSLVLAALPLVAADVPLSDRPVAPLAVNSVVASASPDAVLIVFTDGSEVYAQRLRHDGSPLDPTAIFLANGQRARTVWDGSRWLVFLDGPPIRLVEIDPSGAIEGPHDLGLNKLYYDVAFAAGRTLIAVRDFVADPIARLSLYEIVAGPSVRPVGPTIQVDDPRDVWPAGVNGSPALVTTRWLWGNNPILSTVFTVTAEHQSAEMTVPTTGAAPNVAFVASRASGGLLLWNDGGMRGAILRADGTISTPFPIGPAANLRAGIVTASHDGGYDVLFRTMTEAWIARVAESGAVDARPLDIDVSAISPHVHVLAAREEFDLLIGPRGAPAQGVAVRRIEGGRVDTPSLVGLGAAAQFSARAASGAGLDLVVWIEQGFEGLVLKATRIGPAGTPLDGAGILLADQGLFDSSRYAPSAKRVAFDGEAFVVVWIEHLGPGSRVMMRRIFPDGGTSEPLIVTTWHSVGGVDVVGAGAGRSAVSWFGRETSGSAPRSVLTLIDRGILGAPVEVGSGKLGYSLPRLAANKDRYLAIFNDFWECQITCTSEEQPYGRIFALDGTPLGEAQLLTSEIAWSPAVVSDGEDFFVVWQETLVRIRPDFSIGPEMPLARGGDISLEDGELVIDHGITRAVYSLSGTLLRFEPRGIRKGEAPAAQLSRDRIVVSVPARPARLMIRSLADLPIETADLAVVATGAISLPPASGSSDHSHATATFRIEHRGGGPVRRIELWGGWIALPGELYGATPYRLLDRELREGDSFEVTVRFSSPANPRLWVAGDAVDLIPANNTDTYQRPIRPRGRTLSR